MPKSESTTSDIEAAGAIDWPALQREALAARARAYCPYSNFAVGAALLTDSGRIVIGANVENRSYPATICAERSALVAANALGERSFRALVVAADNHPPARPCGVCLQMLSEFADRLPVRLINTDGDCEELDLAELLPFPFRFTEED